MVIVSSVFRAIADQFEGNEEEHGKYRSRVVQYILKNREMFEPFIEDDVPFEEYCQSMEKDGTWAGHMELQAASLVMRCNIVIHRNMSPRWYIRNFDYHGAQMIHLSYHDEEHYNSVRLKDDPCDGPARPITIKADADLSVASHQAYAVSKKSKHEAGKDITPAGSIKLVMSGSGCENAEKVKQILLQVNGDVDAAIEFLVAEQGTEEELLAESYKHTCKTSTSYGDAVKGSCEQCEEDPLNHTDKQDSTSNSIKSKKDENIIQPDEKKIPRNKLCPCGSKKKYKACCAGRSSTKFPVYQKVESSKSIKDRKQGKKGGQIKNAVSGFDGGPPDLGALCI